MVVRHSSSSFLIVELGHSFSHGSWLRATRSPWPHGLPHCAFCFIYKPHPVPGLLTEGWAVFCTSKLVFLILEHGKLVHLASVRMRSESSLVYSAPPSRILTVSPPAWTTAMALPSPFPFSAQGPLTVLPEPLLCRTPGTPNTSVGRAPPHQPPSAPPELPLHGPVWPSLTITAGQVSVN